MTPPAIGMIVGPTASGKTQLALALAKRRSLEVISADSRQVYRGMQIGSAMPARAERERVPHHLIEVVDPDQPFTVADWVSRARTLVPEIAGRGRLPLVVGGTGLYTSALLDGFDFDVQPWSPAHRARLAVELETGGLAPLAQRLSRLAPNVAAITDLRNPRRLLRALERAELGDRDRPRGDPYRGPLIIIGLDWPRDILAQRILARTRGMFAVGIMAETGRLLDAGYSIELPAMSGHGYREAAAALSGAMSVDEAIAATSRRVRQYARRQLSWFRRDARIHWLAPGDDAVETALALLACLG